jgi:hypothetical protein
MLGSFLPPAPTPSLTTHPAPWGRVFLTASKSKEVKKNHSTKEKAKI